MAGLDGGLTQREMQVYNMTIKGMSATQIAAALHMGKARVYEHLHSICGKLGVGSAEELAPLFQQWLIQERIQDDPAARFMMWLVAKEADNSSKKDEEDEKA